MANQTDKQVQELFKIVQAKKSEIAKLEKPSWNTNGSFGYSKDLNSRVNIHACADVEELVSIVAFLIGKKQNFEEAQTVLGTKVDFKWMGFSDAEWIEDIKTRINKIQISQKRKELEAVESRLDKLISPELKAQMELEEITKMLS